MGFFDGFKLGIIDAMQTSGAFADVLITEEYRPDSRRSPLGTRTICVGFDEIKSETGTAAKYIGVTEDQGAQVYGRNMSIVASFRLFVPTGEGGLGCHEMFSMLADYLLLKQDTYRVSGLRCGEVGYHRGVGAYALTALAEIKTTAVSENETGEDFDEVIVRRLGV
ncbi:MAG: hypothetical protein ACERKO_10690 [Acetanaerobacterium sp.]